MSAEETNKKVTLWTIILGVVAVIPILAALYYWSFYMVRQIGAGGKLESLGELGFAGGSILGFAGLIVIGLVMIDRLRIRHDASTSGEASPVPGLILVLLGVVLAAASVMSAPQLRTEVGAPTLPTTGGAGSANHVPRAAP